jgi:hypothetical protein
MPEFICALYRGRMSDLARAAERQNLRRQTKNVQRIQKAFGAPSGPEGHVLVQRHVDRLTEWPPTRRGL